MFVDMWREECYYHFRGIAVKQTVRLVICYESISNHNFGEARLLFDVYFFFSVFTNLITFTIVFTTVAMVLISLTIKSNIAYPFHFISAGNETR